MIFGEIRQSLGTRPFLHGLRSPLFLFYLFLGLAGCFLPGPPFPHKASAWIWLLAAPFIEELTWRTLLQNELSHYLPDKTFFSRPNVITSFLFALAHFMASPGPLAALTFIPSLLLGHIWAKFSSTWLCGLLHLYFNLCLRL